MTALPSERINFLTHGLGALLWIPLTVFLVFHSAAKGDAVLVSLIYGLGAVFMFGNSALYHRHKKAENEKSLLRSLDHFAIFVMIAGSYTPVVWAWFLEPAKVITLGAQWGITLVGLTLILVWKSRPRWLDLVLYLAMGWIALWVIPWLWDLMTPKVFWLMIGGGILYSLGGIIYGIKKPNPVPGSFGFHEIFHLFILAGAGVHFFMILESLNRILGL